MTLNQGDLIQLSFNPDEDSYGLVLRDIPSAQEGDVAFEVLYKDKLCKLETDGEDWWWEENYDLPVTHILVLVTVKDLQKNKKKIMNNLM